MPHVHGEDAAAVLASLIPSVADLPVAVVIDRVVLNVDGRVEDIVTEYANRDAAGLFGLTLTTDDWEPLGLSINDTLPARAAAQSIAVAETVWATGRTARGTWHLDAPERLDLVFTRVKIEPCFLLGYFEKVSAIDAAAAQKQRHDSELVDLLNASPDGFIVLDESRSRPHAQTVTADFVNNAARAILVELVGIEVVDPSTPVGRVLTDLLNQARGIDAAVRGEWTLSSGGRSVTLAMSTKPLGDGRRVVTFRDVTIKEQLRQEASDATAQALSSRAMLFAALDSLPMPVGVCESVTDADGHAGFWMRFRNAEALSRSTNIRPDADIPVEEALPGMVSVGVLDVMFEVLHSGAPARYHLNLERDPEPPVDYDLVVSRVSPTSVIVIGFDVTEDRQIREDLAAARDRALTYAEERTEFFAALTHELRTPLTTVVSAGQLLLDSPLDDAQRTLARQQLEASRHLLSVINDSLDLRSLGEGHGRLEEDEFALEDVVASIESIMAPLASGQDTVMEFTLGTGVPRLLRGDGFRLERALLNLVSNAVKFTPGGRVGVRLDAQNVRGDEWELLAQVADNGDGIAQESLPNIFAPFRQAHSSTRRTHGGSGLGLALVKQTVERMNGRVWVESQLGVGSTFSFTVRLHAATTANPPSDADLGSAGDAFTSARVLLVEDEDVNRILVTALLEREGLVVDAVDNGLDAVAAALTGIYDIVLMDVRMPVINGFEATQRIRRTLSATDLPVIALTASPTPSIRAEAEAAGMQGTLGKPVDVQRLLDAVRDALAGHGAEVPARP
jgi:signal transduction histidine kinase/ActR/RegA family two-component response regulator